MKQELLEKIFEVVTNMQKEMILLSNKVEENTKQLIEINSNIRYLWEDIKILEERLQKIEYSEIR